MCLSPEGDLFVSHTANHCIRLIKQDGTVSLYAGYPRRIGKENGSRLDASFYAPKGICLDLNGDLIVADCGNNVGRRVSRETGEVSHMAGNGEFALFDGWTTNCSFSHPHTVRLGFEGEILVFTELKDGERALIPAIFPDGRVAFLSEDATRLPFTSAYVNFNNDTIISTCAHTHIKHRHTINVLKSRVQPFRPVVLFSIAPEEYPEAEEDLQKRIYRESPLAAVFVAPPTTQANTAQPKTPRRGPRSSKSSTAASPSPAAPAAAPPSDTDANTSHLGISLSPRLAIYSQANIRRLLETMSKAFVSKPDARLYLVRPDKDAYSYKTRMVWKDMANSDKIVQDMFSSAELYSLFTGPITNISLIGPDGIALALTERISDVLKRFERLGTSTYISALPTGYVALPSQPKYVGRKPKDAKPFGDSYFRVADLRGPYMPPLPRIFRLGRVSLNVEIQDENRLIKKFNVKDGLTFQKLALFAADGFGLPISTQYLRLMEHGDDFPTYCQLNRAQWQETSKEEIPQPTLHVRVLSSLPLTFFVKSVKSPKPIPVAMQSSMHLSNFLPRVTPLLGFHSKDNLRILRGGPNGKSVYLDNTLSSMELRPRETLFIEVRSGTGTITIKTLTGKVTTVGGLDFKKDCVSDLTHAVQEREGIPPDQQRLVFAGQQLQHGNSLAEQGIQNNSTVHLILRLSG